MSEVMEMVRREMGPDAIIISSEEGRDVGGVRVTAALEAGATPPPPETTPEPDQTPSEFEVSHPLPRSKDFDQADVTAVLNHHAIPYATGSHLTEAVEAVEGGTLVEAFADALDTVLRFSPLTDATARPIMLVGPPGVGKTICAAKLTADAVLHERTITLISTDTVKATGIAQLDHFARLMRQKVVQADTPEDLANALQGGHRVGNLTLIDTPGANPFDIQELELLLRFTRAVDAEPVLVMPAGLDPTDGEEIAEVFSRMGCQRFIATRLDAARRYGNLITAARPGRLAMAAISRSPFVAEGLETASPMALARLLTALPKGRGAGNDSQPKRDQ